MCVCVSVNLDRTTGSRWSTGYDKRVLYLSPASYYKKTCTYRRLGWSWQYYSLWATENTKNKYVIVSVSIFLKDIIYNQDYNFGNMQPIELDDYDNIIPCGPQRTPRINMSSFQYQFSGGCHNQPRLWYLRAPAWTSTQARRPSPGRSHRSSGRSRHRPPMQECGSRIGTIGGDKNAEEEND